MGATEDPVSRRASVPRRPRSSCRWELAPLLSVGVLLLAAFALAPMALADNGGFTPVAPESSNADGIRDSFLFVSIFVLAIFVLVEGLLIAFIVKYRRRKRPRFEDGAPIH